MSKPGRSQEPERPPAASRPGRSPPPAGSRTSGGRFPPRSRVPRAAAPQVPPGGPAPRPRVRAWRAAGRDRLARERAELAALERGTRLRAIFLILMGTVLAVAVGDVLAGAAGLSRELEARPLTAAEQARYIREDIAARWHSRPAGLVFPAELQYVALGRAQQYARRIGLAPETSCRSGLDAPLGTLLAEHGCRTLLRATYADQTATFVFTVGIAVLGDEERRAAATAQMSADDRVGVRPVAFPGTESALFGAAQRQRNAWVTAGPYIVFSTAGYADGRTRASIPPEEILHSELWPTAQAIAGRIARALGDEPGSVPRCTRGNVC